jgi:hypothetical protein
MREKIKKKEKEKKRREKETRKRKSWNINERRRKERKKNWQIDPVQNMNSIGSRDSLSRSLLWIRILRDKKNKSDILRR